MELWHGLPHDHPVDVSLLCERARVEVADRDAVGAVGIGGELHGGVVGEDVERPVIGESLGRFVLLRDRADGLFALVVGAHEFDQHRGIGGQRQPFREDLDGVALPLFSRERKPVGVTVGVKPAGDLAGECERLRLRAFVVGRLLLDHDRQAGQ